MDLDIIRENINDYMRIKGITQSDLADQLNMSQGWLSKKLKSKQLARLDFLERVASILEVTYDDLIRERVITQTNRAGDVGGNVSQSNIHGSKEAPNESFISSLEQKAMERDELYSKYFNMQEKVFSLYEENASLNKTIGILKDKIKELEITISELKKKVVGKQSFIDEFINNTTKAEVKC